MSSKNLLRRVALSATLIFRKSKMNSFDFIQSDEKSSRYEELQSIMNSQTVLVVPQFSKIENAILSRMKKENGKFVCSMSFAECCEKFPESVREIAENESPNWGSAFYSEFSWPHCFREKWDTSG